MSAGSSLLPFDSPRVHAKPRVLLIAPHSSYRTTPFLNAAQRLGADVLIASQGSASVVSSLIQGLLVDLQQPDAALARLLQEAARAPFAAIIGTDDGTTELAARTAEALGLPHNPPAALRLARRKDLARARLAQAASDGQEGAIAGARVPRHWRLDLRKPLAAQMEPIAFPCVLKPVAMSASRGVIRADDPQELLVAAARLERILAGEHEGDERHLLLVEEFIPGFEVAVEGLLTGGRLAILAVFDKPDPLDGPFFEETYYITPSRLDAAKQAALGEAILFACRAYGLREGPIHAECRINEDGVWILEVAARTIGGLCARLLRFGTGMGLEELVLAHALERPLPRMSHDTAGGVLMLPIEKGGILRRVEGVTAAERVPFIEEVHIAVREGYELVPLPEGSSYLGFIFARAPTPGQAEAALRAAHARLNVVVAPLFKAAVA